MEYVVYLLGSKLQVFRDRITAALWVRLRDLASGLSKPFVRGHEACFGKYLMNQEKVANLFGKSG